MSWWIVWLIDWVEINAYHELPTLIQSNIRIDLISLFYFSTYMQPKFT